MMPLPPPTARLAFREVREDDGDVLAPILMDPVVKQFWPHPLSRDEVTSWIERMHKRYESEGQTYWLVMRQDSGEGIGHAGLLDHFIDDVTETGLGYVFAKEHWGQGFATEAGRAALDYAFRTMDRERVIAAIRPENGPSLRVAERLAMTYEKTCPYYGFDHGVFVKLRGS